MAPWKQLKGVMEDTYIGLELNYYCCETRVEFLSFSIRNK